MSNTNNNEFESIMQKLLRDYSATCNTKLFNGQIIISENMSESYLQLRSDLVERGTVNIDDIKKYHGLTVQPAKNDGLFTILLNKKYILESTSNKNVDWFGTLIHETVHVDDFKSYFNLVSPDSYDELYDYNLHRMFLYWTEFHARAIGHYFLRKYALEDFKNVIHLENLINVELPFQINYMVTHMNTTSNLDAQMYTVVHLLGRIAEWQHLYPNVFNSKFISELMNSNPWMEELYYLMIKYKTLEVIYPHFDEIEGMLNNYFL